MTEPLPAAVLARPSTGSRGAPFTWNVDPPREGYGTSISHHGEILQGVFEGGTGEVRPALVTLPRFDVRSEVTFTLREGAELTVQPAWKVKAKRAAELTLAVLGREGAGGSLRVSDAIPVGHGFGSSSSDVVATIRATAASVGVVLPADVVARLAVRAEAASDSVMLEGRTVLFAQREGTVVEDLGPSLPALEVVGFSTDEGRGPVLTLDLPVPAYASYELKLFRLLRGALRRAVADQSAELLGRVATASARINQRYLPVPRFDLLESLVARCGAVGLQVAHSGTVAGLLFDRGAPGVAERVAVARRALDELGLASWQFHTGSWMAS